jgi:hypothetical protein
MSTFHDDTGHLEIEDRGAILIVRVDGGAQRFGARPRRGIRLGVRSAGHD